LCDICQETEQVYSYNPGARTGRAWGNVLPTGFRGETSGGMSGGNMSRGNVRLPLQQTINVTQVKQAAQSTTVLPRRQLRADNGSVGHGSVLVTRWPILHCTHPASHVIFWLTISVTACRPQTSRQLRKCTDFLGKAQILLKFQRRTINRCELNLLST